MQHARRGFSAARAAVAAAGLMLAAAGPVRAADPPAVEPQRLAGNTLSAVVYVARPAGAVGGGLRRIVLQAYLADSGGALVRQWLPERNSYSAARQTRWSLAQNRLCIELPDTAVAAVREVCAVVHIWGPRIAGIGISPYA